MKSRILSYLTYLTFVVFTLGISGYFWVYKVGPFIDTSFELSLLQKSKNFSGYLSLIRGEDNQPPGQRIFTYLLFHLTQDSMNLTRLLTILFLGMSSTGTFLFLKRRIGFNKNSMVTAYLFVFLIAISPAIMSAFSVQRYSSSMALLWTIGVLLAASSIQEKRASYALASGMVAGLALLFSYTAIALIITVSIFFMTSFRRGFSACLLGIAPGVVLSSWWWFTAGSAFHERVLAKGEMSLSRQIGALWENVMWPLVGPTNLPSWALVISMATVFAALAINRDLLVRFDVRIRLLLVAQLFIPILIFSYTGLANANLAGPTLVILSYTLAKLGQFPKHQWKRCSLIVALLSIKILSSLGIFYNYNVLRPHYWSNQSSHVVTELSEKSKKNPLKIFTLTDLNISTQLVSERSIQSVDVSLGQETLFIAPGDLFLWSDEIDKSFALNEFRQHIQERQLKLNLIKQFGKYTQTPNRTFLRMYNTDGFQYHLYEIVRK
jgi:hypothetical protein